MNEHRLTCVAITDATPTIRTFAFQPEHGAIAFEAGQSMTLALEIAGQRLYRTFSISSSPARGDLIEMTIKAHPNGTATRWLHDNVRPGSTITARRPQGMFTLNRRTSDRLALISAGSGATPLISMLRATADTGLDLDIAWVHAARTRDEILFAADLEMLQRRLPRLSVAITVSRPAPGWFGYTGRISRQLLAAAAPDLAHREIFCCGPTGFMQDVRLIAAAEGGLRAPFHTESYGPAPTGAAKPATAPTPGAPQYALTVGARTIGVAAGETILQAASRQGLVIPCGCGQGMCGTCMVRKTSGDVEMRHQGGISPEDETRGYILACSTRLLSDTEIEM
jgi:glycine betaine catabolism B